MRVNKEFKPPEKIFLKTEEKRGRFYFCGGSKNNALMSNIET